MTDETLPLPVEKPFAKLRFAGGRFDSHAIPLEVLPDLAAYRKLIVAVAKTLYKKHRGARVRVPKGFEDSFHIGLSKVEGGNSAVAELPRISYPRNNGNSRYSIASNQANFIDYEFPEFDEAREYIDAVIGAVSASGEVPENFPVELAKIFNSFGQNLRDDEFIEMGYGGSTSVIYNKKIRREIVLSREATYEDSLDAEFTLNGGTLNSLAVHVLGIDGDPYSFFPSSPEDFHKAYARASQKVRLTGTGVFDKNDRLKKILDAEIDYGDKGASQPFDERLDEIAKTEPGWYSEANPAPSHLAIDAMRRFLWSMIEHELSHRITLPYLYPSPDGGVVAEWTTGSVETSAEVDFHGRGMSISSVDTSALTERNIHLKMDDLSILDKFYSFMVKSSATD